MASLICLASGPMSLAQLQTRNPLDGFDGQQPLPQEVAFKFFVSVISTQELQISWDLAPRHYLYRHRFEFSLRHGPDDRWQAISFSLPDGIKTRDQFFGDIEIYYDRVAALLNLPPGDNDNISLLIQYQGCADWGYCYPPQSVEYALTQSGVQR
jgi:thioredoxin:protein disulfide reductase